MRDLDGTASSVPISLGIVVPLDDHFESRELNPSFDDINKLCRGTNAKPEELKEMCLYN